MKSDPLTPPYTYDYPKADNTVDIVVFGIHQGHRTLNVLLIQRRDDPFQGHWAIPGGFVNIDESLRDAAERELMEETHAEPGHLEQLYTFGNPVRDPRGRIISTVYMVLVRPEALTIQADDDASDARWFDVKALPPMLAFDHKRILELALDRLRSKLRWQPVGVGLLPPKFTLGEMKAIYEIVLGRTLDKSNFRRRVFSYKVLKEVGTRGRAILYRFDKKKYASLQKTGVDFEV